MVVVVVFVVVLDVVCLLSFEEQKRKQTSRTFRAAEKLPFDASGGGRRRSLKNELNHFLKRTKKKFFLPKIFPSRLQESFFRSFENFRKNFGNTGSRTFAESRVLFRRKKNRFRELSMNSFFDGAGAELWTN